MLGGPGIPKLPAFRPQVGQAAAAAAFAGLLTRPAFPPLPPGTGAAVLPFQQSFASTAAPQGLQAAGIPPGLQPSGISAPGGAAPQGPTQPGPAQPAVAPAAAHQDVLIQIRQGVASHDKEGVKKALAIARQQNTQIDAGILNMLKQWLGEEAFNAAMTGSVQQSQPKTPAAKAPAAKAPDPSSASTAPVAKAQPLVPAAKAQPLVLIRQGVASQDKSSVRAALRIALQEGTSIEPAVCDMLQQWLGPGDEALQNIMQLRALSSGAAAVAKLPAAAASSAPAAATAALPAAAATPAKAVAPMLGSTAKAATLGTALSKSSMAAPPQAAAVLPQPVLPTPAATMPQPCPEAPKLPQMPGPVLAPAVAASAPGATAAPAKAADVSVVESAPTPAAKQQQQQPQPQPEVAPPKQQPAVEEDWKPAPARKLEPAPPVIMKAPVLNTPAKPPEPEVDMDLSFDSFLQELGSVEVAPEAPEEAEPAEPPERKPKKKRKRGKEPSPERPPLPPEEEKPPPPQERLPEPPGPVAPSSPRRAAPKPMTKPPARPQKDEWGREVLPEKDDKAQKEAWEYMTEKSASSWGSGNFFSFDAF